LIFTNLEFYRILFDYLIFLLFFRSAETPWQFVHWTSYHFSVLIDSVVEKNHRLKPVSEEKRRNSSQRGSRDLSVKKDPSPLGSEWSCLGSLTHKMTNGFLDSIATTRNQLGQRCSRRFLERRRIWSMERRDHAWKIRTARSAHHTVWAFMSIRRTYYRASKNPIAMRDRRDEKTASPVISFFSPCLSRFAWPDYLFSVCQNEWLMTPRC